jgi:proline iminopeptidase
MKTIFLTLFSLLIAQISFGQNEFYSKAYGSSENQAIIFLHGGPGYNAFSFEFSTAQKLADNGFYVIVYDQRGCGRTKSDTNSRYTFKEAFADLNSIYKKYNVKTATLIGHSFGGTLGILFSKNFPEKVENLILVGSPLSYQLTFKGIISKCKKIYTDTKSPQLKYIEMLEKMDTTSLEYSSYCFMHAINCGFYKPKNSTQESKIINDTLKKSTSISYLSNMTREPVSGFYQNEHYTTLNLSADLTDLKKKLKVFGIYGQEDGLFDDIHLTLLKSTIGAENFTLVAESSHNVFIDQQTTFIDLLKKHIGKK